MIKPPSVFGHECAGTVVAINEIKGESTAGRIKVGDHLVIANSAPCGSCYFCERGQENLCEDLQFLNGAYAEFLPVPARFVEKNTYQIPKNISFPEAAMVEPLACVVHGLDETAPRKGDVVAVIGLGPIGLMFIALLKNQGMTVLAVGRHSPRLDLARGLGADQVWEADPTGHWMDHLKSYARLDVVIEATGRPEIWERAVMLVRKGGVVNLFGGCPAGTKISLDTNRLHYDQVTLKSSFHHRPSSIRSALKAITEGVVKPKQFITDEKPLEQLPGLLKSMMNSKQAVKTCIIPVGR
jgi:L-iditol 2-dehydrogenase